MFGTKGMPYLCFIISRVLIDEVKVYFENSPASDSRTRFLPLNLDTASIVRLTSRDPVAFAIKLFVALVLGL
jgi:hypothetical protein